MFYLPTTALLDPVHDLYFFAADLGFRPEPGLFKIPLEVGGHIHDDFSLTVFPIIDFIFYVAPIGLHVSDSAIRSYAYHASRSLPAMRPYQPMWGIPGADRGKAAICTRNTDD